MVSINPCKRYSSSELYIIVSDLLDQVELSNQEEVIPNQEEVSTDRESLKHSLSLADEPSAKKSK